MEQQSERRIERLQTMLSRRRLDAVVLGMPANVLWASGFDMVGTFYFTTALVTAVHPPALLVHRAELDMARSDTSLQDIAVWGHGEDHVDALGTWLSARIGSLPGKRVGVELDDWLRPRDLDLIRERLGFEWVDIGAEVETLRQRIDGPDLERVADAGRIADMAVAAGASVVAAGRSEHEIAAAVQRCYTLAGGQEQPVALSVRSGPRIPIVHALPSSRRLAAGDPVAIEVWANLRRCTAVSATTMVTGAPTAELVLAWNALQAVFESVEAISGESSAGSMWEAAAEAAGTYDAQLQEPVGVGLALAFPLRPTTRWRLAHEMVPPQPGQVICIAPRVSRSGESVFAARTYHVASSAEAGVVLKPLTHAPELWSVPR